MIATLCWLFVLETSLFAQELEISVSPTPVGSGARAAAMGNAFVAIADDATAASWNPAGLVQLERPEVSMAYMFNGVSDAFSAFDHPEVSSRHGIQNLDLNYLSFVYPVPRLILGKNVSLALNYQRKYDLSREFSLDYRSAFASRAGTVTNQLLTMDFEQSGGLSTITPAVAFELTHRVSVGVAVNLWESSLLNENGWQQTTVTEGISLTSGIPTYTHTRTKERYEDFSGVNLTLGGLWSIKEKWRLALRYDTAFSGEADYEREGASIRMRLPTVTTRPSLLVVPRNTRSEREIRFPASLALGAIRGTTG
ncbi:MAG: outer membrane protein transport protein [Candidatus Hydrogenedentes bacterium]|nr:outer membrane protein transport protein [Candidatus Hydrogenedentota bacterium]